MHEFINLCPLIFIVTMIFFKINLFLLFNSPLLARNDSLSLFPESLVKWQQATRKYYQWAFILSTNTYETWYENMIVRKYGHFYISWLDRIKIYPPFFHSISNVYDNVFLFFFVRAFYLYNIVIVLGSRRNSKIKVEKMKRKNFCVVSVCWWSLYAKNIKFIFMFSAPAFFRPIKKENVNLNSK